MKTYKNIDDYIKDYPNNVQKILKDFRLLVNKLAPGAVETINYGIPTFKLNGKNLLHFGGYISHIGFYPTPMAIEEFKNNLNGYETSKGTIKFPFDKTIPWDLVEKIVKFRIKALTK